MLHAWLLLLPQVLIETNTRNKKKMVTTVTGLELFAVKLSDASKAFGKKFACGCSVTKSPTGTDQIDMQAWLSSTKVAICGNAPSRMCFCAG